MHGQTCTQVAQDTHLQDRLSVRNPFSQAGGLSAHGLLPCRVKRAFSHGTNSLDGAANQLFGLAGVVAGGNMKQHNPFGVQPNFGEQPLDRVDADLRAVVALR